VLWKVDAGVLKWRDAQTAEAFACTSRTVFNLLQRFETRRLFSRLEIHSQA